MQSVSEFSARPLWLQKAVAAALQHVEYEANTVVVAKGAIPTEGGVALYLVTEGELITTVAQVDGAALSSGEILGSLDSE